MNICDIILCSTVVLLVTYANADPSECYYCDNYSTCNDPLVVSQAQIRSCVENQTCIKFSGIVEGKHETWRDCYQKIMDGWDFCPWATKVFFDWTSVSCSTCDTDLCNG